MEDGLEENIKAPYCRQVLFGKKKTRKNNKLQQDLSNKYIGAYNIKNNRK